MKNQDNNEMKNYEIELAYIEVKKTSNSEIYAQGFYEDSFKNCVSGTVLEQSDIE